jgi:hypothetical protein
VQVPGVTGGAPAPSHQSRTVNDRNTIPVNFVEPLNACGQVRVAGLFKVLSDGELTTSCGRSITGIAGWLLLAV